MSTDVTKMLVWKYGNDVKLWRHKQRTPNANDHMTLNQTPPWTFSAYATERNRYSTCVIITNKYLEWMPLLLNSVYGLIA